ncbi:hypothetical protein HOD29_05005 [archaeon]|jgi:hypothetical protein|nr:hypothetical protein [archaeon]
MDNHLNISLNKTILAIVETALSNFTPDKVLLIPVHYLLAHPTITNLESTVYFVFYRPDNFTFVGMFESDKSIENLNSKTKITKLSFHDSAWKTDGVQKTLFRIFSNIQEAIGEKEGWRVSFSLGVMNKGEFYDARLKNLSLSDEKEVEIELIQETY